MGQFIDFKKVVQKQFKSMSKFNLFVTDVEKEMLWDSYLNSFPKGTNEIFRERAEYDCQCCKQFITNYGKVVYIDPDNKLVSIWDIEIEGYYQVVADAMSKLVKKQLIKDVFVSSFNKLGTDYNNQVTENGTLRWDHFYFELPNNFAKEKDLIGGLLSKSRSGKDVFKRSLLEISLDAGETVLELIEQNSIYRGEEFKAIVEIFLKSKEKFLLLGSEEQKDNFCWLTSLTVLGIRNTVIGTLLVDIAEGKELDDAVRMFEAKVAPTNYKRPSALITKRMIEKAQEKVNELGIEDSLKRRHACIDDISINNVLFADRSNKRVKNKFETVFDDLKKDIPVEIKKLEKVEEVDIKIFIKDILPKVTSVEVCFENKHIGNLMSLISPTHKESKRIFKWKNNFSWNYNGEVTDSIKERVKKAGGNVNGVLRCSGSWFNYDDLDIHIVEPNGNHICFQNKKMIHVSSGVLDVDMNVGEGESRNPVENIVWTEKNKMKEGLYHFFMHNYTFRENIDIGFDAEIEYDGVIYRFHYSKKVTGSVTIAKFNFSQKEGLTLVESLPPVKASKQVWGVATNKFHKVSMVLHSPNHWDNRKEGNKHYFFILADCINDKTARGFFNEFLKEDLREHRKVFEVLGSKMKVEKSQDQLSGLGFSTTQRNHVFCKVKGSFTRTIKINF